MFNIKLEAIYKALGLNQDPIQKYPRDTEDQNIDHKIKDDTLKDDTLKDMPENYDSELLNSISKLAKPAQIMEKKNKPNSDFSPLPPLTQEQETSLIESAITTDVGRNALCSVMANPIEQNIDYRGIARRCLVIDKSWNTDQVPEYNIIADDVIISIDSEKVQESKIYERVIKVPVHTFKINPTISIDIFRGKKFRALDVIVQAARKAFVKNEDEMLFKLVNDVTKDNIIALNKNICAVDLLALKTKVELSGHQCSKFIMNVSQFNEILLWRDSVLDLVTMNEIKQTGLVASIWGVDILVSEYVEPGNIYAFADAEFVGVIPITQTTTVISADRIELEKYGWLITTKFGMVILCPNGVALGKK